MVSLAKVKLWQTARQVTLCLNVNTFCNFSNVPKMCSGNYLDLISKQFSVFHNEELSDFYLLPSRLLLFSTSMRLRRAEYVINL
jgi:hypothetical protein